MARERRPARRVRALICAVPWILWVILGWGFFVALDAMRTYFHRPTTEAEIQREIERLQTGR